MNNAVWFLIRYEWIFFLRNRALFIMLLATLGLGVCAIYHGMAEIRTHQENINLLRNLEQEEFAGYKQSFTREMISLEEERVHDVASKPAFAWFRHGYHAFLEPEPAAALCIGQRDLHRYYYRLTGMSLHYQLFEHELANPVNLLTGNFDLAFVIVYLFPLLVIAFSYPVYAADLESGTLALLRLQPVSVNKMIFARLLFYFLLLTAALLILLCIGFSLIGFTLGSVAPGTVFTWTITTVLYLLFWFSLMFLVISFLKGTAFNALSGIACWLLFIFVIPATLNIVTEITYPLDSTALAELTRRTSLENEDDPVEARAVIREYLQHHPQIDRPGVMDKELMAKAYAAFTALKDLNNRQMAEGYYRQVREREKFAGSFRWLNPAVNTHEILAGASATDLGTFLDFQGNVTSFHRQITGFYFRRLFADQQLTAEDYQQLPVYRKDKIRQSNWPRFTGLSAILAAILFLSGLAYLKIRQKII